MTAMTVPGKYSMTSCCRIFVVMTEFPTACPFLSTCDFLPRSDSKMNVSLPPRLVDIAHLERAAERGPAAGPSGLRLLSNINSRPAVATHAPTLTPPSATATATAPTKIKLDISMGVPLGGELDANGAEHSSPGVADDRENDGGADDCDSDGDADDRYSDADVDGGEQQPQGEDEDSDGDEDVDVEGEDALVSLLDAGNAPDHLLSEDEDVDEGEESCHST